MKSLSMAPMPEKKISWPAILMRLCFYLVSTHLAGFAHGQEHPAEIDFAKHILPILADNCFTCHGPDEATREGGFRLDTFESILSEADSGARPVVPGDITASEILVRMTSDSDTEVMPPIEHKKRPSPEEIELLKRWISEGAAWKEHWAFQKPIRPALPDVKDKHWIRNEVDHFVLSKLEAQHLSPSPVASPETLVRRLHLDLIGLPPSPKQVDQFLNDKSPDAYEKLVDRLLASENYGEHMATFWMDAARFADTNGYQNDFRRSMWLWRDWVINAYNNNMPYDQFTIEQLAGDMLPEATLSQKIASGFNRNHRSNTEGGSINEEWLVENVVDRVETTSTVFLGLTMGCARCHDHKFDPLSQKEFYQFFAYFNNIDEKGVYTETRGNAGPTVSVPSDKFEATLNKLSKKVELARNKLSMQKQVAQSSLHEWKKALQATVYSTENNHKISFLPGEGTTIPDAVATQQSRLISTNRVKKLSFGPVLSINGKPESRVELETDFQFDSSVGFTVSAMVRPEKYGAIISRMDEGNAYRGFDMLITPDGRMNVHLIHDWPGNGTKVTTQIPLPKNEWSHVAVTCESPGKAANLKIYFNGQETPFKIDNDSLDGITTTDHPTWLGLRSKTPHFAGDIADIRLWDSALVSKSIDQLFSRTMKRVAIAAASGKDTDANNLLWNVHEQSQTIQARRDLQNAKIELERARSKMPTTMVMKELQQPRETWILNRGLYDQPDKTQLISAQVPTLFKTDARPGNRLELAHWIVDGNNPLTGRVTVNHYWARYFGIGILETPENFGVQSPPPSHPLLLDWLATEFVRSGWNVKAMQKLIVTSATYRQSSNADSEAFAQDPRNRHLARGPRFRLPAETIRDNALAISGLLVNKLGGPSVKPYQPEGLWAELAGGAGEPPYQQATNEDLYRRSIYIYRKRTVPHPTMTTFDGVGRDICAVSRDRTNTPLQALALLNDTTYVEASIHLAARAMQESVGPSDWMSFAFRCATGRLPLPPELTVLENAYSKYLAHFESDPESAKLLIQSGQTTSDSGLQPVPLAALASVCSVILNLDEVITRE